MDDSPLPDFAAVPVRARRDGWTPRRQRLFVALLRSGRRPSRAARRVGMTKQTAYELRNRPGAEAFAAAWDEAVARARRDRIERHRSARGPSLGERARQGYWTPRSYRGRVVSWTHRYDNGALMRILNAIDRYIDRHPGIEERTIDVDIEGEMEKLLPGSSIGLGEIAGMPRQLGQLSAARRGSGGEIRREPAQLGQFPATAPRPLAALRPTPQPLREAIRPATALRSP